MPCSVRRMGVRQCDLWSKRRVGCRREPGGAGARHAYRSRTRRFAMCGRRIVLREIAEALFVTGATVKSHLTGVLAKLGLRDRAQAVVFGYENGLIPPVSVASSGRTRSRKAAQSI